MTPNRWRRRLGDRVVRRPRERELLPVRFRQHHRHRVLLPAATSALLSLTLSFAVLTAAGTMLLRLPAAGVSDGGAPWITALFTATSAACVTGLVVVGSADYWTGFGQAVIAGLMFLGGLGIMIAGLVILTAIGRRISLNQRLVVREAMGGLSLGSMMRVGRYVVLFAVGAQLVGFVVLFGRLVFRYDAPTAAWQALFHTISAFNNAGFVIFPDSTSLSAFQNDPLVLWSIGILIVLGALSFPVVNEVYRRLTPNRWSLDTRLVVVGTLALWAIGALVFAAFETTNAGTLGPMSVVGKISNGAFQALTSRTAGFSSIDFAQTADATDAVYMLLMFIGGASGSVAGGIKINTAMVLVVVGLAAVQGRPRAEIFKRELPYAQIARALALLLLTLTMLLGLVVALAATESANIDGGLFGFADVAFETVSAFGTTGLSRGITAQLSDPGKLVVTLAMYLGRLGPLTIALGLALHERRVPYRYATERVRIG